MIVDPREGSRWVSAAMRPFRIATVERQMPCGDVAFMGEGPEGPIRVGVELKTLNDFLACLVDKRLAAGQMPRMLESYARSWIVVEGIYRPDKDTGCIQEMAVGRGKAIWRTHRSRITYAELDSYITAIEFETPIRVKRTGTRIETAWALADLYRVCRKPWGTHRLLKVFHEDVRWGGMVPPSWEHEIASRFKGIGWEKAKDVVKRFKTFEEMAHGTEQEWAEIPGIGKVLARRAYRAVRGQHRD